MQSYQPGVREHYLIGRQSTLVIYFYHPGRLPVFLFGECLLYSGRGSKRAALQQEFLAFFDLFLLFLGMSMSCQVLNII